MSVTIRKACINDIDLLVKLRIDYMLAQKECNPQFDKLSKNLYEYLAERIPNDTVIAMLAEDNGTTVSSAFMVINEMLPRHDDLPNKVAALFNVYTYHEHRRKGYAFKTLQALLEEAKRLNVAMIELSATDMGVPLYKKLGFRESRYTTMKLKFYEQGF